MMKPIAVPLLVLMSAFCFAQNTLNYAGAPSGVARFAIPLHSSMSVDRAHAIAAVNSILRANAAACKLKHGPIIATRVKVGWRVTTKVTLSGSGRPFTATAVWTVRDSEAVPGNQLTAEIGQGCP